MGGNGAFLKSHPSSPPLSSSSPQATFRLLVKIRLVGPREEGCNFGIGEEWRGAFFSWHSVCTLVHFSKKKDISLVTKRDMTQRFAGYFRSEKLKTSLLQGMFKQKMMEPFFFVYLYSALQMGIATFPQNTWMNDESSKEMVDLHNFSTSMPHLISHYCFHFLPVKVSPPFGGRGKKKEI